MSMWKKWIQTLTKVVETNSFHSFSPLTRYVCSYLLLPSLWSLSRVYAAVQRIHFIRQQKTIKSVGIRCISVGNITAGGNGKTPLCEYLAKRFSQQHKVLIVGNGYSNDEQRLLQWKLREHNVVVGSGRNRLQVIEEVQKEHSDVRTVILDDGFQCVSVRRDADLLILNALNPFSNHCLIPRGTLREPLSSVSRGHLFLLNHANLVSSQQLQFIQDTIHSCECSSSN
jgi:tetraacyldisaccharide 4'-kinase